MKPGNFILVQGSGPISDGIAFFERSGFTHAALVSGESTILEATPNGIEENPISYERYAVFEFIDATDEQLKGMVDFGRSRLGEGYSYRQDAGFAVNGILEEMGFERIPGLLAEKKKIVCSAFVDLCARSQRLVARPDRKPGDVTPPGLSYSSKVRFTENHNLWEL
ncbi:hypothetical protein DEAC_c16900 [Desulfosporosinus acididurans]|uniref:Uncharacterized protein n=1 Tax=Desulfosporosinus acididurans TaxID=476652 RepID=A0A0J1INP1_9FIRM|nr:hypothetical protein [Desulfosporosinus acididurans]KLU66291.1 hypothetical protein DEAC_c16900 [Desulfosporosinus acididurans]